MQKSPRKVSELFSLEGRHLKRPRLCLAVTRGPHPGKACCLHCLWSEVQQVQHPCQQYCAGVLKTLLPHSSAHMNLSQEATPQGPVSCLATAGVGLGLAFLPSGSLSTLTCPTAQQGRRGKGKRTRKRKVQEKYMEGQGK